MLSKLLLLLFSLVLLSENASSRKRYLVQTENGKSYLALLENPKNTNGKVTKDTDVEAKLPAGKKRDKKRKNLKCEPPARCSVKKKASGGDYDSAMVSCGNHEAKNCAACPQGHGAGRCNGDCVWKDDQCHHGPTTVASTVPITVPTLPTTVPTVATTVPAPKCGKYVRINGVPINDLHPCPPGTEITTERECREDANTRQHYNPFHYNIWRGNFLRCAVPKNCRCHIGTGGINGQFQGALVFAIPGQANLPGQTWYAAVCRAC